MEKYNIQPMFSDLYIDEKGNLLEVVTFGEEKVDYSVYGLAEHIIFGIYFSSKQY